MQQLYSHSPSYALNGLIALFPFCILPFSPFLTFFLSLLIMLVFSAALNTQNRVFLSVATILGGAFLNGDIKPFYDFGTYHGVFSAIAEGRDAFSAFGAGIELAMPSIYFLWAKIFGKLAPQHFIMLQIIFTSSIFYIWLEVYGIKKVAPHQKALAIATTFIFFDFWMAGFGVRQIVASIFMLFAVCTRSANLAWIFFGVSVLFHSTSVVFYPVIWLLYNRPKIGLLLCVIGGILSLFLFDLIEFLRTLDTHFKLLQAYRDKIWFYLGNPIDYDIGVRSIVYAVLTTLLALIYVDKNFKRWRAVILGLNLLYFLAIFSHGHFSYRLAMISVFLLPGYFIFLGLRKLPFLLLLFSLTALLFLASVKSVFTNLTAATIWEHYDIIGPFFHYLQ